MHHTEKAAAAALVYIFFYLFKHACILRIRVILHIYFVSWTVSHSHTYALAIKAALQIYYGDLLFFLILQQRFGGGRIFFYYYFQEKRDLEEKVVSV